MRSAVGIAGVLLLLLAAPSATVVSTSSTWSWVTVLVRYQVVWREGIWVDLRELLRLAMPALFVIGVLITLAIWRQSRRLAVAYVVVGVTANLLNQAVKHDLLPGGGAVNPLSGHAGLVGAVCLGALAFWPRRPSSVAVIGALAAISSICVGLVLVGWHTVPQLLESLGLVLGCVVLGSAICPRSPSPGRACTASAAVGAGFLGVAAAAHVVARDFSDMKGDGPTALALSMAAAVAIAVLVTGITLVAAQLVESPH